MRKKINPKLSTIYPDTGGYTGFSIFIWNTNFSLLEELVFENKWGSFHPDRVYKNIIKRGEFYLEGRFFVFGSLLSHVLVSTKSEEADRLHDDILKKWTFVMDEITSSISALMKEKERSGVHIDEVVSKETIKKLDQLSTSWS